MTITLGSTTLCSGDSRNDTGSPVGPSDMKGGLVPGSVQRQYIGGAGVSPEHVGCDRKTLSFGVSRTFQSVDLALAYLSGPFLSEAKTGALLFDSATYMTSAVVTRRTFAHVGCTVHVNYEIEGY